MKKLIMVAAGCMVMVASSAAWAADVTVAGLNAPNGALSVDADTTVLTNGFNATLPSALAAEATLWFAADTNVIADENGGVTEWRDVREAANAETRLYKAALAYLPEEGEDGYAYRSELPVLTTTNVLPRASAKVVDFGSYGSGRWLYFAAPGGTNLTRVTIGSFFTVIGFDSTCGHILGDVGQLGAGGVASTYGVMFFHKGLGSGTGGNISTTDEGNSVMHLGETRLDGARVDPRTTKYNYNAFQLFSQNGPDRTTRGTPYASTFFNNKNFKATNGGSLARQGGGKIAEFIAFDRVLSDAERREVEAYLAAKYFGVPVAGRVEVAAGATLATGVDGLTATSYRAAVLSDSCGAGTIRKTGGGTLLLERPVSIDATRLDLAEGRFEMGHVHLSPFAAPCVNRKYMVGTWWWTSIGARTDGFLSVEGTDALDAAVSFYPGDWAGRAILVKDMTGTIRNLPEPYTPPATGIAETNLLVNGGFEEPVITSSSGYVQGSGAQPRGWELNNSSVANALSLYGKTWRTTTDDRVEGNQVFALTGNGSNYADIQQTFAAPFAGLYRLTFWAGRRENRSEKEGELRMLVFLDDKQVGLHVNCADHRGDRDAMRQFSLPLPPLAAGNHTIRFRLDGNVTTDRSVILDDVRVFPVAKGEYISVPNPGFESVEMISVDANNGYFKWRPAEADWTFVSDSGICGHSTWFSCLRSRPAPGEELEDLHKAFLQKDKTIISTTVTAPRDGQVVFTMRYGNRANSGWQDAVGATRTTGQTCRVLLDGAEIGSVQPTCEAMRTFVSAPFAVTAGEHTLTIENAANGAGDVSTVVDDIRIGYDTTAYVGKGETLSASVTAPSNGFYRLDVPAIGAELQLGHVNGSGNGVSHYPVTAYVYLDGALTSKIRLERPEWTTFALVLPYLTAGAHTFAFTVSSNGAETGTDGRFRVGKLDLQPLAFRETAPADAMKDTTIRLDAGGKLDLQFEGVMSLGKLEIDGASVLGDVGAASDPTHFSGPGVLRVLPKGTVILFR